MRSLASLGSMLTALVLLGAAGAAAGDVASWTTADLDCRTYPFVGQRSNASEPVFGDYNTSDFVGVFDNRDSQIQLGFNTGAKGIPTGLALTDCQITSVTLTITAGAPVGSPAYDPTYDDVSTYPLADAPAPTPDSDAGRPITLFGLGFRNGYTALELGSTPVAGPPLFGQSGEGYASSAFGQGIRHAYPIDFDEDGNARDVSNNLDEPHLGLSAFNVNPFAIGTCALTPGALIPDATVFTFSVNVADPDILNYLREGLAAGHLGFSLATLNPATGGPGGGGGGAYHNFYLTESGNHAPTLEIVYQIGPPPSCPGDVDGNGTTDVFDFAVFSSNFGVGAGATHEQGDLDGNGSVDVFDFAILAGNFGCAP